MKKIFFAILMIVGAAAFQNTAFAAQVKGVVVAVSPESKMMTIVDRASNKEDYQLYNVKFGDDAKFEGAESLSEINPGDEVVLEDVTPTEQFSRDVLKVSQIDSAKQIQVSPKE